MKDHSLWSDRGREEGERQSEQKHPAVKCRGIKEEAHDKLDSVMKNTLEAGQATVERCR